MNFVVGSKNPVKIKAMESVTKDLWPEAEVKSSDVDSGVSDQPTSEEEAIRGAVNRARRSLEGERADFGVGLEGSVAINEWGTFVTGWAAVTNRDEEVFIGGGGRLRLPEKAARRIEKGEELGTIMDEVTGEEDVDKGPGAIGVFTDGLITRAEAYREALIFSLAEILAPEYY